MAHAATVKSIKMRSCTWRCSALAVVLGLVFSSGQAQIKTATVPLAPYGAMTQQELDVMHPIPDPPPRYKGYITSGPPDGIAWSGVGTLAVDAHSTVYVGLPIWVTGYAPKNAARGNGDKLRVLVVKANAAGKVERTIDFPTKSLSRLSLHLAEDGTLVVFANDKLMRVDHDGYPTTQLDIQNEEKEFELWDVVGSTTGRTLRIRLNNNHTVIIDANTLKIVKQCQTANENNDTGTFTDDLELSSQVKTGFPNVTHTLARQMFCEKRQQLEQFGAIDFWPAAVNDGQFLAIQKGAIALNMLSGESIWTRTPPQPLFFDTFEGRDELSRDGSRVALRLMKNVQQHGPDTMDPTDIRNGTWNRTRTVHVEDSVGVWDVATGHLAAVVPLRGHTENRYLEPTAQIALSPDGKFLAVLEDGSLTLWTLN
jgi:hypothetical protein